MDITIIIDGKEAVVDARRILDLSVQDEETKKLREAARISGQFVDNAAIIDEDQIVLGIRLDYTAGNHSSCYYAFLQCYEEDGKPIVEPTVDDVPEELKESIYRTRWEQVNNPSEIDFDFKGEVIGVETMLLIFPSEYESSIFDYQTLRQLAIQQGVFRPYPGK